MSTKTNNSDISSSNEDGTLYKFDDLRSLTSFNSSEMSRDTKHPDSGIGTSTTSSCLNRRDKTNNFVVKKVELIDELKSLLNMSPKSNSKSQINSKMGSLQFDITESVTDSGKDNNSLESITNSSSINVPSNEENDVDLIMLKAIQYIKKLKKKQKSKGSDSATTLETSRRNTRESSSPSLSTEESSNKEVFANICYNNEDMCISILVKTGLIVYVDERLTNLLGQSAKAWIGRRPIDYLYKDDINLLLTKLCELTTKINTGSNISEIDIEPFFLRFKKELNKLLTILNETDVNTKLTSSDSQFLLNNGPNSNDLMPRLTYIHESNEYIAFRVELKADKVELKISDFDEKSKTHLIQNPHQSKHHQEQFNLETCILFKLTFPTIAYFQDIDNYTERSFITEHDINLHINRVENKVTELLGFLPQELERNSIIKFIHPDDLVKLKQIHFDIFDGKERQNQEIYRWRCHNGCFVSVRTNWSWFIHPWKKQIDFIIGKHVVLVDPMNKNIFEDKKLEVNSKSTTQPKCVNLTQPKPMKITNLTSTHIVSNASCATNSDESNNDKRTFNISSSRDDDESGFSNKIEKDIIEYISKKIPGMDDATQMLGQDVIRFIKKKNISASYCQEQSRIMKKQGKQMHKYKPPKSFKYAYDYPQYFQSRPKLEKSAVKRLANFHSFHANKNSQHFRSSSSSNSGYVPRRPKRADAATRRKNKNPTEHSEPENTTDASKINQLSSNESEPKEARTGWASEGSQRNRANKRLPSLFEDIFSKKSFQPSLLKDHALFTQYMICKYIDDLPSSWTMEDETAMATGENTTQESVEAKSALKRPLDHTDQLADHFELPGTKGRKHSSAQNSESATTTICAKGTTFLGDKTMLDFLLNTTSGEQDEQAKKANSCSSRSHSRIVLVDENDNDDEEETVKVVISLNSEENAAEYVDPRSIERPCTPTIVAASSKAELKSGSEAKHAQRLTKDSLAKHTREQDELYLLDILKKVHKTFAKKISEHPQNICAQAPNVFSCNEYEPKMKKLKKYEAGSAASSAQLVAQYDIELHRGPYSGAIDQMDFDNPQKYHESFGKKLHADLALSKQMQPSDKRSRMDMGSHNATNCSAKDKESSGNSSSSNSQPSVASHKNDDLMGFWRKCIRHGSTIVKRIKECDNIIKVINASSHKKCTLHSNAQQEHTVAPTRDLNLTNMDKIHSTALNQSLNEQTNILKLTKQLKKRLYVTASLLGVNTDIGFDDISIDSEKSEIVESLMKKIVGELLNSNNSANLAQYYSKVSGHSPKHLDTNCIELLTSVYEDLKHKFLSQFDRFSRDSKLIFNSSSSAALTSNNGDEFGSLHPNQIGAKSKSPNDFELSSHCTNEFDDSSTYLYDSPTSSLESTDMLSVSNGKKVRGLVKSRTKSCKSKLSSEVRLPKQKQDSGLEAGFDDGLICKIMQNYIDLFKTNESGATGAHETKCCAKSAKTSTDESSKIIVENSSNDTFSFESKSNKAKTSESKNDEEECVKNLSLNIYNDCFKCLSNVSVLDKQKNALNENESD